MAVVARKTSKGTVYWVATSYGKGRVQWERVGTIHREAKRLDDQRRREVKAGTFAAGTLSPRATVATWCSKWAERRTNRTAHEDQRAIRYALDVDWFAAMRLGDLTAHDSMRLVSELRGRLDLAPKSIGNIWSSLRTCLRDAYLAELTSRDCGAIPRGTVPKGARSVRGSMTIDEVETLLARPVAGVDRLVYWAIQLYTGARQGEVAGLLWSDWDREPAPMTALHISKQWDGEPLKTDRPRVAPVHPELALLLDWWRTTGWELHMCRKPDPGDRIVAAADPRRVRAGGGHSPSSVDGSWRSTVERLAMRHRVNHETRHTMISHARNRGADVDALRQITHNPRGTIIDAYTHRDWQPLCDAVAVLPYRIKFLDALLDRSALASMKDAPLFDTCSGKLTGWDARKRVVSCRFTSEAAPREVPVPAAFPGRSLALGASQTADDVADAYRAAMARRAA